MTKLIGCDSLDLSDNPIRSFQDLGTIPQLEELNLSKTLIESFQFVQPQPALTRIWLSGAPVGHYVASDVMSVIAFGSNVQYLNGHPISAKARSLGENFRPKFLTYLREGWLIMGFDPLRGMHVKTKARRVFAWSGETSNIPIPPPSDLRKRKVLPLAKKTKPAKMECDQSTSRSRHQRNSSVPPSSVTSPCTQTEVEPENSIYTPAIAAPTSHQTYSAVTALDQATSAAISAVKADSATLSAGQLDSAIATVPQVDSAIAAPNQVTSVPARPNPNDADDVSEASEAFISIESDDEELGPISLGHQEVDLPAVQVEMKPAEPVEIRLYDDLSYDEALRLLTPAFQPALQADSSGLLSRTSSLAEFLPLEVLEQEIAADARCAKQNSGISSAISNPANLRIDKATEQPRGSRHRKSSTRGRNV
jgi:hypothetical protein